MSATQSQKDATALFPERELTIGGKTVVVNEITFHQGLRLAVLIRPMIEDFAALFDGDPDDGEGPELVSISELFAKHAERFMQLLSASTRQPLEWLDTLSDEEGQLLQMTFWSVNAGFFTRRAVGKNLHKRMATAAKTAAAKTAAAKTASPTSSPG